MTLGSWEVNTQEGSTCEQAGSARGAGKGGESTKCPQHGQARMKLTTFPGLRLTPCLPGHVLILDWAQLCTGFLNVTFISFEMQTYRILSKTQLPYYCQESARTGKTQEGNHTGFSFTEEKALGERSCRGLVWKVRPFQLLKLRASQLQGFNHHCFKVFQLRTEAHLSLVNSNPVSRGKPLVGLYVTHAILQVSESLGQIHLQQVP